MDAAIDAPQSRYYHSQGARLRRRYSLGPSSTRPRTLGYPWARALPRSSRYADARCAGLWAWWRRFRGGWNELASSVGNRGATNHCRPGLGGFLRGRTMYAGGARSMVDHGLATPAAVPWSGADARHRRDNDSRRRAWAR